MRRSTRFHLAEYRLRHRERFHGWDERKRWAYCMNAAIEAALERKMMPREVTSEKGNLNDSSSTEQCGPTAPEKVR